jgi:excinuclease UvrABC helicase subunit UvrB
VVSARRTRIRGGQPEGAELPKAEVRYLISELEVQMKEDAGNQELKKAALPCDQIFGLRKPLEGEDMLEGGGYGRSAPGMARLETRWRVGP